MFEATKKYYFKALSAPNPSICFLLVDFHIFQELIFEKTFEKYWILFFTSARSEGSLVNIFTYRSH